MKTINDVTILFVDDEPDLLRSLRRFLRKEPYRTIFAGSGAEALDRLAAQPVDIVVSDLRMPQMDGLALLDRVKAGYPDVIRLILSATRDVEQAIEAINAGEVYRFISKPLDPEPFKRIIRDTVDYRLLTTEREEMMAEIENRLLKTSPPTRLTGATTAALMISAGHLAGDFADYFVYDDRHVDILIGDVMGKGVQSALVAASIKHRFAKALALNDGRVTPRRTFPESGAGVHNLAQVVSRVHAMCIESLLELEIFATLIFARFDLETGKIGIVDCGHLPVIHYRAGTGACALIKGDNYALGMARQHAYQVVDRVVAPGDLLLFYSDGVTESRSPAGDMFGEQRLAELVQRCHDQPPAELMETIRAEAAAFCGGEHFDDDFSCIALRVDAAP
jgi:phosphoserine phosphatase RsbU/P